MIKRKEKWKKSNYLYLLNFNCQNVQIEKSFMWWIIYTPLLIKITIKEYKEFKLHVYLFFLAKLYSLFIKNCDDCDLYVIKS